MITTSSYTEVAVAGGAWVCPLLLPATPFGQVHDVLAQLARDTGWPVAAFAYGDTDEPVEELLLYRDPSKTFGTPPVEECDDAVRALVATTGWRTVPERAPTGGVLVGLGLREGYEAGASQHEPAEVAARLNAHGGSWQCRTARLVSARLVDDVVRWYDEVGVVLHASPRLLPAIATLAHEFAQHRFVVTSLTTRQTRAFQR
ncbi:hypothetical protein MOQ72_34210 [Saccharopolyspora sp. K220]|uniref:hypothetical protein n=1 Tax=Saccharopolyspora soli TaxID=2926618 RepID=UPI001F591314|nr:hypothetical protein [Saccharopolyspora soli]MCI2422494.1 hypothetical protein [Saccharopolyspora soli]